MDNKKLGIGLGVAAGVAALIGLSKKGTAPEEPGPIPLPDMSSIWGHVTDVVTGKPISNISVVAGDLTVSTDSTGRFELPDVSPGVYLIEFTDSTGNYQTASVEVSIAADEIRELSIIMVSTIGETYPCPYCSYVAMTEQELMDHIAEMHPQEGLSCYWIDATWGVVYTGDIAVFVGEIINSGTETENGVDLDILDAGGNLVETLHDDKSFSPGSRESVEFFYHPDVVGEYTASCLGKTVKFTVAENVTGQFWCPFGCVRAEIIGYGPKEQPWSDSCEQGFIGQNGECPIWDIGTPPYYETSEEMVSHLSCHIYAAYGWPTSYFQVKCPYCSWQKVVTYGQTTGEAANEIGRQATLELFQHILSNHNGFTFSKTEPKRQAAKKKATARLWIKLYRLKQRYYGDESIPPSFDEFTAYLHEPRKRPLSSGETVFGSSNGTVVLYGDIDSKYMWRYVCEYYQALRHNKKRLYFGSFNPCTKI